MGPLYVADDRKRRRLWPSRRPRVAVAACVDRPDRLGVVSHNGRVCRFAGWVASPLGREVVVRVSTGAESFEVVPSIPRPDAVAAYGSEYGFDDPVCGFTFYVDVPPRGGDGGSATVALEFTDGRVTARSETFRLLPDPEPGQLDTYVGDTFVKSDLAKRRLAGAGLEIGALHQPLEVDPTRCAMRYADRLTRQQALEIFPELAPFAERIVEPDLMVDVATGDLGELGGSGVDFIVANDVIEHLPNPIKFIRDLANVVDPGGLIFLSVPDRDYTFDVARELTALDHLWGDYQGGIIDVDDDHIRDFLLHTSLPALPVDPSELRDLFEQHRRRSIHVHVWDQRSFDEFLADVIRRLDLNLEVTDRITSRQGEGSMTYVLEKQ
jgi:SAM-dependent methyltransferase